MRKITLTWIAVLAMFAATYVVADPEAPAADTPETASAQQVSAQGPELDAMSDDAGDPLLDPMTALLAFADLTPQKVFLAGCDHTDPCPPGIPDCNSCNDFCTDFGSCMSCCASAFSTCMAACTGVDLPCYRQCRHESRACRSGCSTLPF